MKYLFNFLILLALIVTCSCAKAPQAQPLTTKVTVKYVSDQEIYDIICSTESLLKRDGGQLFIDETSAQAISKRFSSNFYPKQGAIDFACKELVKNKRNNLPNFYAAFMIFLASLIDERRFNRGEFSSVFRGLIFFYNDKDRILDNGSNWIWQDTVDGRKFKARSLQIGSGAVIFSISRYWQDCKDEQIEKYFKIPANSE